MIVASEISQEELDRPSYSLHEEKDWTVEVTVVSRKFNETSPQANILTENKIVTRDIVSDSRLLEILNFVQPKTEI